MKTIKPANAKNIAFGVLSLLAIVLAIAIIPAKAQDGVGSASAGASAFDEALLREAAQNARSRVYSAESVTAAGPGLRVVPATEFRRTFALGTSGGSFEGGYIRATEGEGTSDEFLAPVRLPDGALLTKMTAYILDNSSYGVDVWLLKKDYTFATSFTIPAYIGSTSADTLVRPYSNELASAEKVDNSRYMYYILVRLASPNHRLYAVTLEFSYHAQLPLVMHNYSYCSVLPGNHEIEPNENRDQANLFCLDVPITGNPNDSYPAAELDWYRLEWNAQGTLQIDLTNFVADAQLILYKGQTEVTKDFTPDVNNNFQVTYNGAAGPGTYYILATAGLSRPAQATDYTLTVSVH